MALYEFTREDFVKVVKDSRFLKGVQIAVEENFFPSKNSFRGDTELLSILEGLNRKDLWRHVKNYPLPYISYCEDYNFYAKKYGNDNHMTINVKEDFQTRQKLLDQAKDKFEPAWWCYVHSCEVQSIFILYPMCRILFPNKRFSLYSTLLHKVLINSPIDKYQTDQRGQKFTRNINQPCFFDLILQLFGGDIQWFFNKFTEIPPEIIPPENMIEWYVKNYGYIGIDVERMNTWFQSLS